MIHLIIGCSEKKLQGTHPCFEIYRGALWNIIRKNFHSKHRKHIKLYAFSCKYGIIPDTKIIKNYNARLSVNPNPTRKNEIYYEKIIPYIKPQLMRYNIQKAYVCCGSTYLKALQGCGIKILPIGSSSDGIGKKGTKLKYFLNKLK